MIDNCNINSLAKESGLCYFSFARYSQKCVTQIYRALYGDAMLVPNWMGTNMATGKQQVRNICDSVLLQKRKFISRGTLKQYSTTFSNARTVLLAKFPKRSLGISHFLTSSAVRYIPRHA